MVTVLPLTFTEDGLLTDPNEQAQIIAALQSAELSISDLWIFSHGWNNGRDDALHLYNDEFIPCMQEAIAALQPVKYNLLYVGVIWPSKGWEEFSNTSQPAPGASTSSLQKPVASLIAQPPISKAEFIDTFARLPLRQDGKNDEFGAIGANGMQGFEQNRFVFSAMNDMNQPYTWGDLSQVYCVNIDGQKFISANTPLEGAHNDINHPEIFQAALSLSLYGI